jgi:hypothetical protein
MEEMEILLQTILISPKKREMKYITPTFKLFLEYLIILRKQLLKP